MTRRASARCPEGSGENGWRLSEAHDSNADNNSNHPYIVVRPSLLFDDRPSSPGFARFCSSPFGPFSFVGRDRNQLAISGDPCHSPQSGPNDRRFRPPSHGFARSGGGFAEWTLYAYRGVAAIQNPGLFCRSSDKPFDTWLWRKLCSDGCNYVGAGTCRARICRTSDFVGRNRVLRCDGSRGPSWYLA